MAKKKPAKKSKGKNKKDIKKVMTPKFRVAFASVFNARSQENEDGTESKPKYSLVMIFDEDEDLAKMTKLAKQAAKDKWGDKIPRSARVNPFRDGGEKEDEGIEGFEEGMQFATASTFFRPGIVDKDREAIIDQDEFYSGCYARATVTAYAYEVKGNKGCSFGLMNIQKLKDGDQLSGRTSAEDDFGDDDDEDDWDE